MPIDIDVQTEQALAAVSRIDLTAIKSKLYNKKHGLGWSLEDCETAERLYKQFLTLQILYKNAEQIIVPPKIVDEFWHQHILDTRKYAEDCKILFGRFLHHFPYFGMNGEEDEMALEDAGQSTLELYKSHFGEEVAYIVASCKGSCSSCRS